VGGFAVSLSVAAPDDDDEDEDEDVLSNDGEAAVAAVRDSQALILVHPAAC